MGRKQILFEDSECAIEECNKKVKKKGFQKNGKQRLGKYCGQHDKAIYWSKKYSYLMYKKTICEKCGFVPEHDCQLDVDHIDGNKCNNQEENLQTLCANCHRLKTFLNEDYLNK